LPLIPCLPQFQARGTERVVLLYVIKWIDFVHWAGTDVLRLDDLRETASDRLSADANNLLGRSHLEPALDVFTVIL
jgi:hypothetical protein